jgi:hypothetical protein
LRAIETCRKPSLARLQTTQLTVIFPTANIATSAYNTMSATYAEYTLFMILISTYAALTYVSQIIPYKVPATTDEFLILDGNIDYLYDLVVRLDHMLETIYFGFLIALLFLGLCYGQLQRRVAHFEQVVNVLAQTVMVTGAAVIEHPAYHIVDKKRDDGGVTWEGLLTRVEYLENRRAADNLRMVTLELNAINAQRTGIEAQGAGAVLPTYNEDAAQPAL